MSSLVGGHSILHIANRLGDMKKDNINSGEGEMDLSCRLLENQSPPPSDDNSGAYALFKNNSPYPTSPSTSAHRLSDDHGGSATPPSEGGQPGSDEASNDGVPGGVGGGGEEGGRTETGHGNIPAMDLAAAMSQMQQQLAANQQAMMAVQQHDMKMEPDNMITMRDLMPGYSPWLRNAGRKKSHPVWDFFKDLKDTNGVGGVVCLHCSWTGDDRSPNNLRTHLKKFHTADGIFAKFSQKLAQTPTQPYVKRARAGGQNQQHHQNQQMPTGTDSVALALQQLSNAAQMGTPLSSSLNFLDHLPKSNEVINISAGFTGQEEEETAENGNEPGSSGASASGDRAVSGSPTGETSGGSPSVSSTNQLNAFMNMASNPLMWNAMLNTANTSSSSHGSAFSLNDGQCVSMLMKMALDLDLTLSYHKRRGDIELCFESNRTAEKSGGRGKVLCLSDMGREIRVTERVNGAPTDTEMWTKTDFNQFHWAIRGKCQKVLVKS